ncbi:putative DNA-binding transcriptional regulator YafY [Actinoplanes lutulentus]|uniref:Putative DNA-binding transcriptional regulator YafY n=1 Tax=Actinoplanes lutulentus TaxID=1287878 RepID=A0A327Z903_9ACTN|nr:YafY family protein [Actinoplanes lutulentus]MBB2947661.1 putative DNA-binding transcriptional regulator YafY [Actinoplanes lutulentus]RAK27717.1 putative DNA-binding transcriptional regulator YafY [Actinoplanes lutulentus]
MTRPAARVLALLEILQNGGTHTAPALAGRLGVDERTVRRYAEHLLDLEIPVESVRGRYGGYRLAPGFRMPPLMLTDEEALAVLLGLVAARRAGLMAMSDDATESAAAKVRRVLPKTLAARLDALFATAGFTTAAREAPTAEASVMLLLAEATRQRRPALIDYSDRSGRRSRRTLHPYGLVAHSGRWYVTGPDSASGQMRTFRLDRIGYAEILHGGFTVPDDFDPSGAVLSSLAGAPWRHEVVVAVQGTAEQIRLPRGLATVEPDADPEWVVVKLRAERLDWIPALLAGLDLPFTIRQPPELRAVVREWAQQIAAYVETR